MAAGINRYGYVGIFVQDDGRQLACCDHHWRILKTGSGHAYYKNSHDRHGMHILWCIRDSVLYTIPPTNRKRLTICQRAFCDPAYQSRYKATNNDAVPSSKKGHAKGNNKKILTRICHFVAHHQQNWDLSVQLFTYPYNAQLPLSTNPAPFRLVRARRSPPITFYSPSAHPSDVYHETNSHLLRAQLLYQIHAFQLRISPNSLWSKHKINGTTTWRFVVFQCSNSVRWSASTHLRM